MHCQNMPVRTATSVPFTGSQRTINLCFRSACLRSRSSVRLRSLGNDEERWQGTRARTDNVNLPYTKSVRSDNQPESSSSGKQDTQTSNGWVAETWSKLTNSQRAWVVLATLAMLIAVPRFGLLIIVGVERVIVGTLLAIEEVIGGLILKSAALAGSLAFLLLVLAGIWAFVLDKKETTR